MSAQLLCLREKAMPRLLLVANVAKEHVLKFHVPTIKHLKENGWYVDVACSGEEDVPFCDHQFRMSYRRSPFNLGLIKGIIELKRVIQDGKYDVVYCHTPVGGIAARIAALKARKNGTRVIYMAHGYHFYKGAPIINRLLYYPVEKLLSYVTDAIILINNEDFELTKKHFKTCKAYRVPGIGVDLDRLKVENKESVRLEYRRQLAIPLDATVLIYLAELLPNKNQTFLMRVLKRVLDSDENVYLVLAGFDHSNGAFERYAEEIGVRDHVRFLGWREDVGNLYAMADICTAASIREGFGLNLVEAMACGLPVIATQNRGHVSIIEDGKTGFLVSLGDEAGFADRTLELIKDPFLRERITAKENDLYKYSSQATVNTIMKILEENLNKD